MKYDIDWGHTYEQDKRARELDRQWNIKLKKYQTEAWAFFGLLIIELDRHVKELVSDDDQGNFHLTESYTVYKRGRRRQIRRIKGMVNFMRHGFCHPEEDSALRLDPYISDRLRKEPRDQDRSYHRVHLLKDPSGKYYVQIGGGKLFFSEISRAIRLVNKLLRVRSG